MELLNRTASIWSEKTSEEPKRTVLTTDDQGFTLVSSKKAVGPKRGPGRPRKVVKTPAAPKIAPAEALLVGWTFLTLRIPEPSDEELPSLFKIS